MNRTLDYYNQNASAFAEGTLSVDFTVIQENFLSYLPKGAKILDLGCGAGRDTKYFLQKGYQVVAVDGSEELCKIATEYTGIQVTQMLFQDLCWENEFDGVWACGSLLHLKPAELVVVLQRIAKAMKEKATFYASFKYGEFEGERNGRYFLDLDLKQLEEMLVKVPELVVVDCDVTKDVRSERNEKWLNVFMEKRVY